jgi:hypothetical protein
LEEELVGVGREAIQAFHYPFATAPSAFEWGVGGVNMPSPANPKARRT